MKGRKIQVVNYDSIWPAAFEAEKEILHSILGKLAIQIEHIGSTAVPGLTAKPIIDILIEVTDINQLDMKAADFSAVGYEVKGENGIAGRRYYQKGGNNRSHHIHAFQSGSDNLFRHRVFKAYLIAHPDVAQRYAIIKRQAARECANDNKLYMSLKNGFISEHEKLAMQWFALQKELHDKK